jgi:ribosome-associated protein
MERKSKTQKKKEAQALQSLGERLVTLSAGQIEDLHLPEELYDAVTFAKTLKSRGAQKRQMQYIGTLMRKIDSEPVQEALHNMEQGNCRKAEAFKETEKWRDELMNGNDMLMETILKKYPDVDRQQLTGLVRQARKEKTGDKPPRAYRTLFRYLINIRTL